jgi:membrane dipeptidase
MTSATHTAIPSFGTFDFALSREAEARAHALHESSIVIDMLCQGPCGRRAFTATMEDEIKGFISRACGIADAWNFVVELPIRHALAGTDGGTLERCWRDSGVTAGTRERDFTSLRDILAGLALAAAQFERLPWFVKATSADDIRAAKQSGKIAGFINSQDTVGFGTDLSLLEQARDLGLRMLQLTYNTANFVGSGCTERHDGGLTHFGVRLVSRANELGVVVDTGHCGPRTTLDACAVTRKPLVASHTSAKALFNVDRAKSDNEIRAVAETGGVVGVYAVPFFLSGDPEPTVESMLDHIDYITDLVGWQHVGIGTDWPLQMSEWALRHIAQPWSAAFGFRPEHRIDCTRSLIGFDDYRDFPNLTRGLVARRYSDDQIRGILGENFLRVLAEVVT